MGLSIAHGIGIPFKKNSFSWSRYCIPQSIDVVQISGGNRITWTESPLCTEADGYEIWVSIAGAAYALLDTVATGLGTYDDTTDYAGSQVTYKVRAYKGTSYSDYSGESEIVIEPDITNLAASWVDDFARITFDGFAGWTTEIYESRDNVNWTLVTTLADGIETYDNYTWQGTTVYFRARAKLGSEYGDYTASISIATPLVFKVDQNPRTSYGAIGPFALAAGKTITVDWGDGHTTNYTTTGDPVHNYTTCGAGAADPYYVKLSGHIDSITKLYINSDSLSYGNISKWVLPTSLTDLRLYGCAFTGDLSSWAIPASCTIVYLSTNQFTGIPRGHLEQLEGSTAGMSFGGNNCNTAAIDAWLAYAHAYLDAVPPIRNAYWYLANSPMGIPTGGNSNTDLVACRAIYAAAGFSLNAIVRTS